jgi:hypothetical protein
MGRTMGKIWKYVINRVDVMCLDLPDGAEVLTAAMQNGDITLWILVDPNAELRKRPFYVVGTGNPFPPEAKTFIGTVFDGPFVWHIFEGAPHQ